ncbi:hypothetical protein [Streptomyces sp. NPDC003635]
MSAPTEAARTTADRTTAGRATAGGTATAGTATAGTTAGYGTVEHFLGLLLPGGLEPEASCPGRLVSARTVTHQNPPARERGKGQGRRRKT